MPKIDMSKFEGHTPKPWRNSTSHAQVFGDGAWWEPRDLVPLRFKEICSYNPNGHNVEDVIEKKANIALIETAPEMKDRIIELEAEVERLKDEVAVLAYELRPFAEDYERVKGLWSADELIDMRFNGFPTKLGFGHFEHARDAIAKYKEQGGQDGKG